MRTWDWLRAASAWVARKGGQTDNADPSGASPPLPELEGMSEVEGREYSMRQIRRWLVTAELNQAGTFADRVEGASRVWSERGLEMPYWSQLWILRAYQAELGLRPAPEMPLDETGMITGAALSTRNRE